MKHSCVLIVVCLLLFWWYQRLWLESLEHFNTSFKYITIPSATALQILVIRLFVQQIVEAKNKGTHRSSALLAVCEGNLPVTDVFPSPLGKDKKCGKKSHAKMTSWNGNIFRVTGLLCGEFTGHRCIPLTKGSDAKLWYFLWSAPEQTIE